MVEDFARAVRRWRDRVAPQDVGLPSGGRRRAPGLRREELAQQAGISLDYLTRLEQGRARHPSSQVVEALARALRLTAGERAHLFGLAGLAAPGPETVNGFITPSTQRMLDRLAHAPVAVYDACWTLLVANPPYAGLMGDMSGCRGHERNAVWRHFAGPAGRTRHTPQSRRDLEVALVSDLRGAAARYPADARLRDLIADLLDRSTRFARLWNSGSVGHHEAARKTIDHPQVGVLRLDCDVLTVATSDLRIMIYTAEPGTVDAQRLDLVAVLGLQDLATAK